VKRAKDNAFPNKTMFPLDKRNLHCVILGISTLYAFRRRTEASRRHIA
jgi:hypothetical protein